jgi:hypothetical protein
MQAQGAPTKRKSPSAQSCRAFREQTRGGGWGMQRGPHQLNGLAPLAFRLRR